MYTFADNSGEDREIAIFTKRLDTLLASATTDGEEAARLPSALQFLSEDEHLSPDFREVITATIDLMHKASVTTLHKELENSKRYLAQLNANLGGPLEGGYNKARRQLISDRNEVAAEVDRLEALLKKKDKFPTRSTLESFTQAAEEAHLLPPFFILALRNGFGTSATLRKILQSMLSLWGFEHQLR